MSEFMCGNTEGGVASVNATQVYGKVRIEPVKSYPWNWMRVGDRSPSNPRPHFNRGKSHRYLLNGRLGGPQSRCGR